MPPPLCDRFRGYVSLALDGELAELERAMLDSHLEGCAACRAYAADVADTAALLRSAPLERPAHSITVPSVSRRSPIRAFHAAAVGTVAVAAAAFALAVVPGTSRGPATQPTTRPAATTSVTARRAGTARFTGRFRVRSPRTTRPV